MLEGTHEHWTQEELARLAELFPHADRLEILQAFPTRTWTGILSTASDKGIKRYTTKNSSNVPVGLALRDKEILDKLGIESLKEEGLDDYWEYNVSDDSP